MLVLMVVASQLFSACVKEAGEEGVKPDFIPHFTYGGFSYYIHPSLGEMNWNQANNACNALTAYGYYDWFMPSRGEIEAAQKAGFYVYGWSSTDNGRFLFDRAYYYCNSYGDWYEEYPDEDPYDVFPMRKQ